ncbi:Degenerin unc-8 [Toxocara canis]|uniref:Degenerin unc-8 n=1 Tax=Toxocara canis TaxID=6265 RepID=A0A0B2UM36_TOXCA|nr:Degenerin unc-8 [Toxocara canis]
MKRISPKLGGLLLSCLEAPFPAATVCNLNAFKNSELRKHPEISEGLDMWEKQINRIRTDKKSPQPAIQIRKKRGVKYAPVFVRCSCLHADTQCIPQRNPLQRNATVCICFEDVNTGNIWPCYPTTIWTEKECFDCSISDTCDDPDRPNATAVRKHGNSSKCLCQSVSHNCVVMPKKGEIRWWNPNNYSVFTITESPTSSPELVEAFDMKDRKDPIAMTTKAKETLIFMVAALPREVRKNISYNLEEFVLRCSFNSEDCNLERDFKLHMDPEYGNCYTFNFNDSVELKNTRAGPMYGLRLLLNVNQSDYLPTTEAAGVRLVVHEQDQEPFPDTFGYSAPTGFVSSFGLKTKVLQRLDAPYGLCSDTFRPEGYIYEEHYSPEPCRENVFETAYSCSAWPAQNFKIGVDCSAVVDIYNDSKACTEYYRLNTAYIEIYYEQLNFESLKETAGYSIVNLFSDFGGNIGLWIGFSIITMMEIVELICEMTWYIFYRRPMQLLKRKKRREQNQLSRPQLHYRPETPSVFWKTIEPSATFDSNLDFEDSEMIDYSAQSARR